MLKGVNRQVVEVSQPNSQYFERILYIVKPEFSGLSQTKLMNEANKFNKDASSKPPKAKNSKNHVALTLSIVGIIIVSVAAIILIMIK